MKKDLQKVNQLHHMFHLNSNHLKDPLVYLTSIKVWLFSLKWLRINTKPNQSNSKLIYRD